MNNDRKMKKKKNEEKGRKEYTETLPIKDLAVGRIHIYFIKVCFHIDNRLLNERGRGRGREIGYVRAVQIEVLFKLTSGLIKQI